MLTSHLLSGLRWLFAPSPRDPLPRLCVPEWSETMAEHHSAIWWKAKPYTMTSAERVVVLCQSIAYLEKNHIGGAVVECGAGKGGSMMAAALSLLALGTTRRQLYLFDTFAGTPEPAAIDVDWQGRAARDILRLPTAEAELLRAKCSLADVKQTMMLTRYPWEKIIFVPGRVEQTLAAEAPQEIALLRLDTDWYESTYHELEYLYPRLADGGVLIVDDYGNWQGARQAVDDYFGRQGLHVDLQPIDFAARFLVKKATARVLSKAS